MYDNILSYRLKKIIETIQIIEERFNKVNHPNDFVNTPEGLILLDSIVIRLQVIGENVKKCIHKTEKFLTFSAKLTGKRL